MQKLALQGCQTKAKNETLVPLPSAAQSSVVCESGLVCTSRMVLLPNLFRTFCCRLQKPGGSLRQKKSVPERQFWKKTACSSYVQPCLVAIGGWRLVAFGGGWRQLVVGDWWLVAGGSGWQLAGGRHWRLAVGGWWSLGAVLKGGP